MGESLFVRLCVFKFSQQALIRSSTFTGVLLRTQESAVLTGELFRWAVLEKASFLHFTWRKEKGRSAVQGSAAPGQFTAHTRRCFAKDGTQLQLHFYAICQTILEQSGASRSNNNRQDQLVTHNATRKGFLAISSRRQAHFELHTANEPIHWAHREAANSAN